MPLALELLLHVVALVLGLGLAALPLHLLIGERELAATRLVRLDDRVDGGEPVGALRHRGVDGREAGERERDEEHP